MERNVQVLLNKWHEIGQGGFGIIYKNILLNGPMVIMKKLLMVGLVKCQDDFE